MPAEPFLKRPACYWVAASRSSAKFSAPPTVAPTTSETRAKLIDPAHMADEPQQTFDRFLRSVVAGRLYTARWSLLALAICLLVIWAAGFLPAALALIIFAGVLATAALVPPRPLITVEPNGSGADHGSPLDGLSAADLSAAVPDAMIMFDGNGMTVHANEAAVDAFGPFAPGLPLQRKFRAPEMQQLIATLLSGDAESDSVEYSERVPIERAYRVIATRARGVEPMFVLVFKDQSETRRIDRMRADFIANASHELRTPLASIAGFVETLRGPARDDVKARDHFLRIMQEQTARMARLIDDLLSLSRLEMKPFLAPGSEVDIVETVENVIDTLGPMAADTQVEIVRDLPEGPVIVGGNRDELFQVFENLLENACKYGRSGGRVIVSIRPAEAEGEGPSVSFRDFGPGIAAEHIPRITERFYRVDAEASRGQKGTGLGLAIVKHILTRHKARLAIKSEVGKGSEFTVHFPGRTALP
jgi:two-component system, OmpR family, phosphate regulon sensor histidine kinase PhoR